MPENSAELPAAASLAARISAVPAIGNVEEASRRVTDWVSGIGGTGPGETIACCLRDQPLVAQLLGALTQGSPYLWELVTRSPEQFANILQSSPEARFDDIVAQAQAAIACAQDDDEVMRALRKMKSQAALLIALADIGGVWPVMQVTQRLTDVADAAVGAAVEHLIVQARRGGKLKGAAQAHPAAGSGYIVLAMGKMGARELNYSSDIDLIVFYDDQAVPDGTEPAPLFVRLTRTLVKLLQQRTEDGYVFRTDLRLRPDPASTQIAVSVPAALDYYEGRGQNWERAALIKARACAGDIPAGEALLESLAPFIWRKYLDFASVADIHAMKRQMHAYRGHDQIAVEGHNIKLGRGGIREIEFFVQTQQLIAGGRHPELRSRETLHTLNALAAGDWIDSAARDELAAAYRFLRVVENRLQMVADEQTHTLPADRERLEGFAQFAGFADRDAFARALLVQLRAVQHHYATLFEHASAQEAERRRLRFPPDADDRETLDRLTEMGFKQPLETSSLVRGWMRLPYQALRGEFARAELAELVPLLLGHFSRSANPDGAVLAFDRFLSGLHGGARLFSLLRQNPDLLALLALVLGTAPRLADSLAQFPGNIDAVIDPGFFGALPEDADLTLALDRSLRQATTYEDFLDRIRIFAQEQMFLIGTRILSGTVSAEQAGDAFARLADALIRTLHTAIEESFAQQHGRIAEQETAILALGKLGGREMTATSDLDLIVVYDFAVEQPESSGPRSLYGPQYFSRLTQRLISALTAQTNHGVLYRVDMRLRPSGRAGPLATQISGFAAYQDSEAWTWEHMALTRARVVSASPEFARRVEAVIRTVLCRPRDRAAIAGDVVEMRNAIADEKGDADRWNIKYAVGGLLDVEFIAQFLQLTHAEETPEILDTSTARVLEKAWKLGILAVEDAEVLRPAVRLYDDLTQLLRLTLSGPFDPRTAAPGLLVLLARAADVPDFATLEAFLSEMQNKVRTTFNRILSVAA
ncbi:MAG: bifunctional [glutamine synthetase] adenylyltransferase/[glutamine synthetase]-adenylyl-L-tyrosine phosphorylase [Xanthobacteraceae bacterium]